jgi:hypothetical protein
VGSYGSIVGRRSVGYFWDVPRRGNVLSVVSSQISGKYNSVFVTCEHRLLAWSEMINPCVLMFDVSRFSPMN